MIGCILVLTCSCCLACSGLKARLSLERHALCHGLKVLADEVMSKAGKPALYMVSSSEFMYSILPAHGAKKCLRSFGNWLHAGIGYAVAVGMSFQNACHDLLM